MNLTSKRVLQFMTVCAGACALSASAATEWVADSFEEGPNGSAIGLYKPLVIGSTAHAQWVADTGDASVITNGVGTYGTPRPMTTTTDYVLNLATEGQTLSRRVLENVGDVATPVTMPFDAADVYVDTLIKFTPSEDAPVIDTGTIKVAVYVNVNSNLVVCFKTDLGPEGVMTPTNIVVTGLGIIDPATWYRLTIQLGLPAALAPVTACKVYVNGTALTSSLAYADDGAPGGSWFPTLDGGTALSAVAFQGTGMVDELVVTENVPAGIGSLSLLDQWKIANGVSEVDWAANQPAWYYDYLLNVPENTAANISIDSIAVNTGTGVATIDVVASSSLVHFDALNGQLKVKTSADLSTLDAATPVYIPFSVSVDTFTATIPVPLPVGHTFIRAVVE